MAIIQLNPTTFTQIPIAAKSLVQFRSGVARVADSASQWADQVTILHSDLSVFVSGELTEADVDNIIRID